MTKSTDTIEPCLFCDAKPVTGFMGDDDGGYHYVECPHNGMLFCGVHADSPEEAAALWNTRKTSQGAKP